MSVDFCAGRLDDRWPFLQIVLDQPGERQWRLHGRQFEPLRTELVLHGRLLEDLADGVMEAGNDFLGCTCWRHEAEPGVDLIPLDAGVSVGSCGNSDEVLRLVTARPLSLPSLIWLITVGVLQNPMSTSPATPRPRCRAR